MSALRAERERRGEGKWAKEDRSLPVVIVDLSLAIARGTAELPPLAALASVRLADPGAEHPRQLDAVRPEIDVVARVRAKLVPRTVLVAHGARFAGDVRVAQPTFVIPARGIVADVHEEILPKWSSATGAVAHAAAHQMRGRPRDLGVMPDFV